MAKTPSQKLFQIIHMLTPAEKRYLSLRHPKSQADDTKTMKLFEAITKMKELDEATLQRAVYGTSKVEGKKFSELKNYCYQLIMNTLRDYDYETSVDYRLKNQLLYIKSLYKRALYDDCQAMIEKTLRLAIHFEQFEVILELFRWRKQIAYARGDIDFFHAELENIDDSERQYLDKIRNIQFYKNTFLKVHMTIRKYRLLESKEMQAILQQVQFSPLFKDVEHANSHTAKIIFYRVLSLVSYATHDNEMFFAHGRDLLDLMLSKPDLLREDISEYISANSNFVMSCMLTQRFEEGHQAIENFLKVESKTYDDRLKIHRQYYQGKFELCQITGNFEQGYIALQQHLKDRQQFDLQAFNTQGFHYAYFYMAFGSKHYDEALDFLNAWLSSSQTADRQDLQALARLLNLIIHFEMGNTMLIESLMRSATRYLNKRTKVSEFEREILRFVRKASASVSKRELTKIASEVTASLQELSKDSTQGTFMAYFDFSAWIESKILNEDFARVVQKRFEASKTN